MKKKVIMALVMTMALTVASVNLNDTAVLAQDSGTVGDGTGSGNGNQGGNNNETPTFPSSNVQSKKVLISSVSCDKTVIEPGEEFTLTYKIQNNTNSKIYDLSLKIVGVEGKGTLDGFIPVGTTNEIYAGHISASGYKEISVTLRSDVSLKPGAYNFVTSVMYNQWDKEQEEISKLSGVIITSKPQVDLSGVEAFPNGGGYSLAGSVVNSGKTKVKNVVVKAKVNGEELVYNVGSIDVEGEEMFELVVPAIESDTTAEVEVTYEDESGNSYSTQGNCMIQAVNMEDLGVMPGEEIPVEEEKGIWNFIKKLFRFGV